jgi:transposase InsO family protein
MAWREESIVSQRLEFVTLASAEGANIRELCRRFGISAPTGYKWLGRHREVAACPVDRAGASDGEPWLQDRSRRPHRSPGRTGDAVEAVALRVREQHPAWGARKIRAVLISRGIDVPATSTVHAILSRHGRIDPAQKEKHQAWQRFEHDRPNALWQMDFKGHVPMHRGGRCHPLTILDDHSRYSIGLWACGDERSVTVRSRLVDAFRRFGLPERLLCDNGPPWAMPHAEGGKHTGLTVWLLRLGVRTVHGRAFHPQTQGKEERFHRTLKAELLSRMDLRDLAQAQDAFDTWRGTYNLKRPHEALGMGVPASRYTPSTRTYPETLPGVEYADGEVLRRVRSNGLIKYRDADWCVGQAFSGERVAIRPGPADGRLMVCYGPHPVGEIDLHAAGRSDIPDSRRRRPPLAALAPDADGSHHPHV